MKEYESIYEQAVERINSDPALLEFRYVLLEDWNLAGPYRYEMKSYCDTDIPPEQHFRWIVEADRMELIEWAVDTSQEYKELLDERFDDIACDVEYLLNHANEKWQQRILKNIIQRVDIGQRILFQDHIADALGYLRETQNSLVEYSYRCHENPATNVDPEVLKKLEKYAKIQQGGLKGHIAIYGTKEEKQRQRTEYQTFIDNLHLKCPLLSRNFHKYNDVLYIFS